MSNDGKKPSYAEMAIQHTIVFLICIVFPGIVTLLAPATWISLQRSGETVHCTTRTCLYFVVPFKVQNIDGVSAIDFHAKSGRTEFKRKLGRTTDEVVHVDGEGFLQIHGASDKLIEVSVSPASIEGVANKANAFLQSPANQSITIFAIANWKFGAMMGGLLTSFTALYVVGYSLGLLKLIFVGVLKLFRVEQQ